MAMRDDSVFNLIISFANINIEFSPRYRAALIQNEKMDIIIDEKDNALINTYPNLHERSILFQLIFSIVVAISEPHNRFGDNNAFRRVF